MSYRDKERAPGPKKLLALDGGGIRGVITLEVLAALEEMLRAAPGWPRGKSVSEFHDALQRSRPPAVPHGDHEGLRARLAAR